MLEGYLKLFPLAITLDTNANMLNKKATHKSTPSLSYYIA